MSKISRESELATPVMQWLRGRGFTAYGEVPWFSSAIDIVGLHEETIEAVELKLCLTKHVLYQAALRLSSVHKSWCAVASTPRNLEDRICRWNITEKLGVIQVSPNGEVVVLREAVENTPRDESWSEPLRKACAMRSPWGEAGLPTMRGVGPAQTVFDAVATYREANPNADWEAIYENVPNHYCHAKSMRGAMDAVAERRQRQLTRKSNQTTKD